MACFIFVRLLQSEEHNRSLTSIETTLQKHMSIQKESASSSADKDITIMRLQSEIKQSQERIDELQREV